VLVLVGLEGGGDGRGHDTAVGVGVACCVAGLAVKRAE
jgi:hypothetical protein